MPTWGLVKYENIADRNNKSRSTAVYHYPWVSDGSCPGWQAQRAALMTTVDPADPSLICTGVTTKYLQGDTAAAVAELTATWGPAEKVLSKQVNQPFRYRFEAAGQAIQIPGSYYWQSDTMLLSITNPKASVQPVQKYSLIKLVLFGARSSFQLNVYDNYLNKVNSNPVQGVAAGYIYFDTFTAAERTDPDTQAIVWDIECHLLYRPAHTWNSHQRGDTGAWDILLDDATEQPVYGSVSFAPLFAHP